MKKGTIGILSALAGAGAGAVTVSKVMGDKVADVQKMSDKHLALFLMMNQWVRVKQEGKHLADYFTSKGYREIAIYGMSYAGQTLVEELAQSDINIKYGIDKKADAIYSEFDMCYPEDNLEKVDAVVVTTITFFDEVEELLSKQLDCPIISLEDILYTV